MDFRDIINSYLQQESLTELTTWTRALTKSGMSARNTISDLQIGVRVRVLSFEHAHFENFHPPNLKRMLSTENS